MKVQHTRLEKPNVCAIGGKAYKFDKDPDYEGFVADVPDAKARPLVDGKNETFVKATLKPESNTPRRTGLPGHPDGPPDDKGEKAEPPEKGEPSKDEKSKAEKGK